MTIKDIQDTVAGSPVSELQATVKTAFMPNTGTGTRGPWKMQAAILFDDTGEIRATFWDQQKDLRDLKGSVITLAAKGEKSMVAEDRENKKTGAIARELKVNNSVVLDELVPGNYDATQVQTPVVTASVKSHPQTAYGDATRESIERQVALKAAVEYTGTLENIEPDRVVEIAEKFYLFLSGKASVPQPEATSADQII